MTKPLRLSLQISGEMSEEKTAQLVSLLESKIQEAAGQTAGLLPFKFREEDVIRMASAEESVRVTLLCSDIGRLGPCELTTIMGSLAAKSSVFVGEYGVVFPSPNSAKLTPKAHIAA